MLVSKHVLTSDSGMLNVYVYSSIVLQKLNSILHTVQVMSKNMDIQLDLLIPLLFKIRIQSQRNITYVLKKARLQREERTD